MSGSAQAEKNSMVAEIWEILMTNKRTPTTSSLSLTVHRITVSKEATTLHQRLGVGISHNDVRLIANYWTSCITLNHRGILRPGLSSNEPIHRAFDNSDGRQQTINGSQTTHHTTGTMFQVKFDDDDDDDDDDDNDNNTEYSEKGGILHEMKKQILENSRFPRKEHHHQEFQILMMNLLMLNYLIFRSKGILLGYYWLLLEKKF